MVEIGHKYPEAVVLSADLSESLKLQEFRREFPSRFIECGVAEQNMMGVAAGLALAGKMPFVTSFAAFNPGLNLAQLRVAIYSWLNLKVIGGHAGLGVGEDGATHQILEDLAIVGALPKIAIAVPADAAQARQLTLAIARHHGPAYLRLGRSKLPALADLVEELPATRFGHAQILRQGSDLSIFCCGLMVQAALSAATQLHQIGVSVEVINLHTLRPLDEAAIINSVQKTGAYLTACEHQLDSGFNSLIMGTVAKAMGKDLLKPIVAEALGTNSFGESGKDTQILHKYGLDEIGIIKKVKLLLAKKNKLK
jgi:transketolase